MLADEDKDVRRAFNKILTLKGYVAPSQDIEDDDFERRIIEDDEEDKEDNDESNYPPTNKEVRCFP